MTAFTRPMFGLLVYVRFYFSLALATFQSVFTLYAQAKLDLGADKTGYILADAGLISVIKQACGSWAFLC